MSVLGSKTNENGDAILISLQEPYLNVVEVVSFSDIIEGETTDCFYNKFFRWGCDGVTYSDYVPLNSANLEALLLNPNEPFWIQYKYEHVGDCELEFKSISLEIVTNGGIICKVPQIQCCDGQSMTGAQNLVVDCCGSSWNPYDLSRASQNYNVLSAVTSDLFGICTKYFKTSADQRSKDVILKEYSLFNVIQSSEIKILFPDNELPTREFQFNPMMMDFPVQFEVHIVKSAFQAVFGPGSRPEMRDYLYIQQFLNKMYEVDSVSESDDAFYTGSYWRVSLVAYQQRTNVSFSDKNIEEERDSIVSSVESVFKIDRENEFKDVRKPNQYNTIGTLSDDYVRRILDKKVIIKEENIFNNWTIISKYHYELNSMNLNDEAVEYRYSDGWTVNDSRAFTFWVRPKYLNPLGQNILINTIQDSSGFVEFIAPLPTQTNQKISVGDWINISGTASYNGIHQIKQITTNSIVLNLNYIDNTIISIAKFNKEKHCTFLQYSGTDTLVEFTYTPNWFIVKLNDEIFSYSLKSSNLSMMSDRWYAIVLNLNNKARQLSLFIYETIEQTGAINPEHSSELLQKFADVKTIDQISIDNGNSWKLLGCPSDLTNIRIWTKPIELEEQELILSQYVVNDTHLTLLVDNAAPQLLISKTSVNRNLPDV